MCGPDSAIENRPTTFETVAAFGEPGKMTGSGPGCRLTDVNPLTTKGAGFGGFLSPTSRYTECVCVMYHVDCVCASGVCHFAYICNIAVCTVCVVLCRG